MMRHFRKKLHVDDTDSQDSILSLSARKQPGATLQEVSESFQGIPPSWKHMQLRHRVWHLVSIADMWL